MFKKGAAPHTNSFGLGETGRYRTNVWDYAGISSISASRGDQLAMHPTLIAAEKTGRHARLIEYDPLYCDAIIRRWEQHSGKRAVLAESGETFEQVSQQRLSNLLEGV